MRIWGPPVGTDNEAGNEGATLQRIGAEGKKCKHVSKIHITLFIILDLNSGSNVSNLDYVKAVSQVDNLEVEKAPVQNVDNETEGEVSIISSFNNTSILASNENLQPKQEKQMDSSIREQVNNGDIKNQVNNLQIQIEDHLLNDNNSAANTLISNSVPAFSSKVDLQLSAPKINNDISTNTVKTFQTNMLDTATLQEPGTSSIQIQVLEPHYLNREEPKQKLYVEKSRTVIQVIEQNHLFINDGQNNNNETVNSDGTESDSANSENNEYLDATEVDSTLSTKLIASSPPKNISTLNIVLKNSYAQNPSSNQNLQTENSSETSATLEELNLDTTTDVTERKQILEVESIETDEDVNVPNTNMNRNEAIQDSSSEAAETHPSISTLSRKQKKSIVKLKKVAHQRAKNRQKLKANVTSSSGSVSDSNSSDAAATENVLQNTDNLESLNCDEIQDKDMRMEMVVNSHDLKELETEVKTETQQTEIEKLVNKENETELKTSTTIQVAQNSSKTIQAPIKRPSRIPISRQRSKSEQKSPEIITSSRIPIKSTVQTQIPKLSSAQLEDAKNCNMTVQNKDISEQQTNAEQQFENSASIVLQNTEPVNQTSATTSQGCTSQRSNEIANEMEYSVQTLKDINRQLNMQQKPHLTKKNSVESTTSSKQLSYTKSLDNDSDSSVSDSNVEELLDPSTDEDSYEDIEDYEEVDESNTDEYNQFEEQNIKSVNELNINLSQINEKMRELTSTVNHTDEKRKQFIKSHSYIDETCESEDYISEEEDENDEEMSETENLQDVDILKTDLNIEIKQPTELELMQVSFV